MAQEARAAHAPASREYIPSRGVALVLGGQNPITLEYQIYPPPIDTLVTGMGGRGNLGNARKKTFFFKGGVPLLQQCDSWNFSIVHLKSQAGHCCFASYDGRPSPGWLEQSSGMLFPIYSVFAQSCCCSSTEHLLEHSAEESTRLAKTIRTCLNGKHTSWGKSFE